MKTLLDVTCKYLSENRFPSVSYCNTSCKAHSSWLDEHSWIPSAITTGNRMAIVLDELNYSTFG